MHQSTLAGGSEGVSPDFLTIPPVWGLGLHPGPQLSMQEGYTRYIVDELFPANEVHLTGGASGSGKTTLEGQFIEDWRNGRDVFGKPSHPSPFCYVACDRSEQSIQATLERIGVTYKEWPIISMVNHSIDKKFSAVLKAARTMVSDVEVMWIDGIHSLCPGGRINDYQTVSDFVLEMTRICQLHNLTIKAMGHATKVHKGEEFLDPRHRFLGSVAWGGYADTVTIIDQSNPEDPTDTERRINLLPRNGGGQLIVMEFDSTGRLATKTTAEQSAMDVWLTGYMSGDTVSTANILNQAELMKVSRASAYRWIKTSAASGKLLKTGHGLFRVSFRQ